MKIVSLCVRKGNMVRQCFACKKLDYLNANLSFHRIPVNTDIRTTWLSSLGLLFEEKPVPKCACICSDHFLEDDFEYHGVSNRKCLKKGAVPFQKPESPSSSDSASEESQVTPCKRQKIVDDEAGPSIQRSSSSSTLTASEVGDEHFTEPDDPQFPTDRLERLKWFKLLGMEPVFTRNVYLCSDHFEPSSFRVQPMGRRMLRKNALPQKLPSAVSASESDSETEYETESETNTETASETESAATSSKEEPSDATETLVMKVEPEAETTLIQVPFPEASFSSSATVSATESVKDYSEGEVNACNDPLNESFEINAVKEQINDPLEEGQDQPVFIKREELSPIPSATVSSTTEPETKPSILTVGHVQEGTQISTQSLTNESYELKKTQGELEAAKTTIESKNKKIKTLQQQNRRLRARVSCLQSLLRYLEANKLINDNTPLTENGQPHESCSKIISRFLKEP